MTKRKLLSQPKRSVLDIIEARWSFDLDEADAIIAEVGLPLNLTDNEIPPHIEKAHPDRAAAATLAWNLNNTARSLRWEERRQTQPKHAEVQAAAERIEKLCEALLGELEGEDRTIRDGLGSGGLFALAARDHPDSGGAAVSNVVDGVHNLRRWAMELSARSGALRASQPRQPNRSKDESWHALIERLGGIYHFFWHRRPGLTRDPISSAPGGPYFRFVCAVVDHLLPGERTPEAIATAIARHRWGKGANWTP